jgi:hypothetical protein
MPNTTRPELAAAVRRLACEVQWLDQKSDSELLALDKAADLVATAAAYQTVLALEIVGGDSNRPRRLAG